MNASSKDYLVLFILDHVICCRGPLVMSVFNYGAHVDGCFELVGAGLVALHSEPLLEGLKGDLLEAREARVDHELNEVHEIAMVFSHGKVSLDGLLNKELIGLSFLVSTEDLDELFRHLEVCRFKAHVLARTPIKDEAKIDMDNTSLVVHEYVAVMSVLDLKDEAHHAVSCQAPDEVEPRLLKGFA